MNDYSLKSRNSTSSIFSTAGWLFADLLLALGVIFLVSGSKYDKPEIPISLSPTTIASQTNTPTITISFTPTIITETPTNTMNGVEKAGPVGLSSHQCYNIYLPNGSIDNDDIYEMLNNQLPDNPAIRAGLVLIWTHGETVGQGVEMSQQVGQILKAQFPESFSKTEMKSLYFEIGQIYLIQLEIYFYTDSYWSSGYEVTCSYNH